MLRRRTIIQKLMNQPGLVGCWIPEKQGGGTLNDLSGKNNHGVLDGPTWISENGIWMLDYDGINDFVDCGTNDSLHSTEAISLEVWIKPWNNVSTYRLITTDNTLITNKGYSLFLNNGKINFRIGYDTGYITLVTTTGYSANIWQHIVATYDKNEMKIFLNGIKRRQVGEAHSVAYTATDVYLGILVGPVQYFKGQMNIVNIWNKALSSAEIYQNYELVRNLYRV